jgi:hypothetical protein
MLSAVSTLRGGLSRQMAIAKHSSHHHHLSSGLGSLGGGAMRFKSDDAGDVIGIDLGTTNSCVAIMVSCNMTREE